LHFGAGDACPVFKREITGNPMRVALLSFFGGLLFPFVAAAMSVEPLVLELTSSGKEATRSFRVSNTGATQLTIEITVAKVEITPEGELRYQPGGSEFLIYPPQSIIPKGGSQTFRVQWLGEPGLKKSQTFRLAVTQVPVKLPNQTSGIQVNMSFGIIANVAPPQSKAVMTVTDAAVAKDKDGKRVAAIKIKNPGDKHAYFGEAALKLAGSGWSTSFTPSEMSQKVGLGMVQPGKERRFLIPVEVPANVSDITASIDYQPGR
jgi:fimbrial chaperone protein